MLLEGEEPVSFQEILGGSRCEGLGGVFCLFGAVLYIFHLQAICGIVYFHSIIFMILYCYIYIIMIYFYLWVFITIYYFSYCLLVFIII